jgi:hypothetical protein
MIASIKIESSLMTDHSVLLGGKSGSRKGLSKEEGTGTAKGASSIFPHSHAVLGKSPAGTS